MGSPFRMDRSELHVGRLVLLLALVTASIAFWNSPVLTPLKLLAVMGHETGHAFAALVVGGSVDRVSVRPDEGGQCVSQVPDSFLARTLVYSAGYVGSAVISGVLLLLTFRAKAGRLMLGAAAVWLGLMGVLYGRDLFTLVFCLGMAGAFGVGTRFLPPSLVNTVNLLIASFTSLYAVMDLKDDLWDSAVRSQSDAQLLADLTIVPTVVWAALWTIVSVVLLATAAWYALRERTPPLMARARPLTSREP